MGGHDGPPSSDEIIKFSACGPTEEAGRAEFNVATPTYATVAYSVRYIGNSQTKLILNDFKRGSTLNLNGFSVFFFLHKILGIFEFFYLQL